MECTDTTDRILRKRHAIGSASAALSIAFFVTLAGCGNPTIKTPAGEVEDPRPYVERFTNTLDDTPEEKLESAKNIWAAIPEKGRLDGLIEIANSNYDQPLMAAAIAVVGDRMGAGKAARERALMKGVAINPITMAWIIHESCDTLDEAIRIGLELLKNEKPKTRTTGHFLLAMTTHWPIEPHPQYAKENHEVDPSVVELWRALEEGAWTPQTIAMEALRRFHPMTVETKSSDATRSHLILRVLRWPESPVRPGSKDWTAVVQGRTAMLDSHDPADLEKLLTMVPEDLTWDALREHWHILRHIGRPYPW